MPKGNIIGQTMARNPDAYQGLRARISSDLATVSCEPIVPAGQATPADGSAFDRHGILCCPDHESARIMSNTADHQTAAIRYAPATTPCAHAEGGI